MKYQRLVKFFMRYNLQKYVLEWAGLFRYLGHSNREFSISEWTSFIRDNIHPDVLQSFFRILVDEKIILRKNDLYVIEDEIDLQRTFENAHLILTILSDINLENNSKLLWTLPSDLKLPMIISEHFDHLNSWIQQLIQGTNDRLIFFAPYYSEAGLKHFSLSLKTLIAVKKDVKIDWIFGELHNEENGKAINFLQQNFNQYKNINIYLPQQTHERELVIHAKVLLSDSQRGYMGSANFSKGALMSQFELGIKLSKNQTLSLVKLIDYWIQSKFLIQYLSV